MGRRARVGAVLAAALALLGGCAAPTEPSGFEVLGFQEQGGELAIDANADALTYVGIDGVTLTDGGATLPLPDQDAVTALEAAHDAGLPAELLFSNFDGDLGDFSPEIAATLLGSAANRAAVVTSLARAVDQQGWDGVMIDLESMTADDAEGLTAFAHELRTGLPGGVRVDIALMAATDDAGYRDWGYDLPGIADAVDRVTIMTYDQHGPWSDAGPVGALGWQREVVAALRAELPDEPIDLGVAGYGYAWAPGGGRSVSDAEAFELAGGAAVFDDTAGEWTAELEDGTVIWWSDARSYGLRVSLARELGLDGVAVWSLGLSDTLAP